MFDTVVVDLTDDLADPVDVLFGVQPDLMATAIDRGDVAAWAAANDLVLAGPVEG